MIVKDLIGVELLKQSNAEFSQNKFIDLSNLSNGTYFIAMRIGNKETTKRVVLIR
ncbi:MAG: T9SS type A sorting domain-containing protein [Candidatus Kapaibacteriota bacterium]